MYMYIMTYIYTYICIYEQFIFLSSFVFAHLDTAQLHVLLRFSASCLSVMQDLHMVHLNKLECCGKSSFISVIQLKLWNSFIK